MLLYEDVFRALNDAGVKYLVVGGIAYNFLGGAKSTFDLDLLIELEEENLANLSTVLTRLGYKPRNPVPLKDLADPEIRQKWIAEKNMKAFTLIHGDQSLEEVDIIIDSPFSYEAASKDIQYVSIRDFQVPVISLDNLIQMKKNSPRAKDQIDLKELEQLKRLEDES